MYGLSSYGLAPYGQMATSSEPSPETFTVSVSGSLPKLTASVTLNQLGAANQAAVSGSIPKLTGSIALQYQAPIRTASINGQLPVLAGAVSLVSGHPPIAALVNGTLPRFTASIQLNIPGVYPEANADDFTVSAIVDGYFSFESRISPTVGFSAMISSTFKFNGSLN